jgi:phosphoribosylformimino-5-aminoimidazole carboxamide ribotide isomerase
VSERQERIAVAADARGGKVAVEGWERESKIDAAELVRDLADRGVRRFVFTPIEVDGTLRGPALAGLAEAAEAARAHDAELYYSGGVGSLEHLHDLAALGLPALAGVIVGRALYEGVLTVAEGQRMLDRTASG